MSLTPRSGFIPAAESSAVLEQTRTLLTRRDDSVCLEHSRLLFDPPEVWTIAGHQVLAYRAILLAGVPTFATLRQQPDLREQVRSVMAQVFDSTERRLRELSVVLDEHTVQVAADPGTMEHPYRGSGQLAGPPSAEVVRAAAEQYARHLADTVAADVLGRAAIQVDSISVGSLDRRPSYRVEVRMELADLARVGQEPSLRQRISDAVRTVAQTPHRTIAEVIVGADLRGVSGALEAPPPVRRACSLLQDLLASEGVASVVLSSTETGLRLVVSADGKVGLVDVGAKAAPSRRTEMLHLSVEADTADVASVARAICKAIRGS